MLFGAFKPKDTSRFRGSLISDSPLEVLRVHIRRSKCLCWVSLHFVVGNLQDICICVKPVGRVLFEGTLFGVVLKDDFFWVPCRNTHLQEVGNMQISYAARGTTLGTLTELPWGVSDQNPVAGHNDHISYGCTWARLEFVLLKIGTFKQRPSTICCGPECANLP